MLSLAKTWAVARYELTWDLRKKRTYFILGLFLFTAFAFAYLLPTIAGKSITTARFNLGISVDSNLWWVNVVYLVFNTIMSGLFPLLIGGFISTDSLASEFDKNTIVPLLSQPIRRVELYAGKFLEKFFLLLVVSTLFTLLVLAASEAAVGAQAHLDMIPLVVFAEFGAFLEYAALAFFFGSFVRSGSMVLGILVGVFFGISSMVILLALQFGIQESMFLLPVANADFLLNVMPYSIIQPSGNMVLQGALMGAWTPQVTVTVTSAIEYVVAGLAMNLVAAFVAGYYFFRKAEVKG
jgi:ABC-type transport system involved in multi-copper enzyme maturation permease subunit